MFFSFFFKIVPCDCPRDRSVLSRHVANPVSYELGGAVCPCLLALVTTSSESPKYIFYVVTNCSDSRFYVFEALLQFFIIIKGT